MTHRLALDPIQDVPKDTRSMIATELREIADTIEHARQTRDVSVDLMQEAPDFAFTLDHAELSPEVAREALASATGDAKIEITVRWSLAAEKARRRERGRRARRKK